LTYAKIKTMKKIVLFIIICYSFNITGQSETTPTDFNFGTAANFILFTGAGAVANTGTSTVTGDVGADVGAISGFGAPTVLNGTIENANPITVQAILDLAAACVQIQNTAVTIGDHSTIFGDVAGETIYPGVYSTGAATSIIGTLTLDAQGDPNAMFVFKIGGALSSVAGSEIILANGASSDNVFWIAVGAVGLGANATVVGTFIGYPGAVSLGAGGTLDGRFYATIGAIAISGTVAAIPSYNIPFDDDSSAYLFQNNDVFSIDLASGNSYEIATDITTGNINATGYNPADGYIWGSLSSPEKKIVRIGKNFNTTSFYIDELPSSDRTIGDVSADGIYYLKGDGTAYYKIDLDPNSATYTQHQSTESLSQSISIDDWAFNAVDGNLYAVEKNSNILYRIDSSSGVVESLGEVPILSGLTYTYGAVYFDADGRFYVSANETGTIYAIESVQSLAVNDSIDSNLFAFGPSSSNNDGARRPTAAVLQEICDNGIDDDGDGLIDCDDPACSGVGNCPITSNTSGGSEGGLESNNRLSNKVNQRNYNRAKNNYRFDRDIARRVTKSSNYAQRSTNLNFQLQNFIPLTVINEEYVVESTPTDLLGITNAVDVYSVDYIKNENSIASILVLKTVDGVYEHTKYICDRLLGAELISVSTIDINGYSFIKSIIRNTNNSIEFVLSLSAKEINNDENFAIESHWNLDKYESDMTFYNFQIWSNSIDDLLLLGEDVLNLLDIEKPISDYNTSSPPTVFVRKGNYINGTLDLQIVNTNGSEMVTIDGGLRVTETSDIDYLNSTIDLNENYITNLQFETGNLFDIGFRISDASGIPDDLFMSDGPWGIDDSAGTTEIDAYAVLPTTIDFNPNDFSIERNVELQATTSQYVAVYRALTPRFSPVNLSEFSNFKLRAKGTGEMQINFIKKSILTWEEQHSATIQLTESFQDFTISYSDFTNISGSELFLDDIVTVVFTMVSEDGTNVTKEMHIQDVRFSNTSAVLSVSTFDVDSMKISASPNPMDSITTIYFTANQSEKMQFVVYDVLGKRVYQTSINATTGKNKIVLNRQDLGAGFYFCKISSSQSFYKTLKLIVK
jgi:hypothetical protein